MKKGLFLNLVLVISFLVNSSPLLAEFVQRKQGVSLHVYDFSVRPESKLIGGEIGAREIRDLNRKNIYPILIDIHNRSDRDLLLYNSSIAAPMHSESYVKYNVQKVPVWPLFGYFLSCVPLGASLFVAISGLKEGGKKLIENNKFCWGSAGTIMSLLAMIKFIQISIEKQASCSKDQSAWLKKWMLLPEGVCIPAHTKTKKFIFLDKKTYQQGGFALELHSRQGRNIVFDVSLLP